MWTLQESLIAAQVLVLIASTALNVYLYFRARAGAVWRAIADGDERTLADAKRSVDSVAHSVDEVMQQVGISRGVERDLDKRLAVLESRLGGIPSHQDLVGIRQALARLESRLGERISAVDERSTATLAAVNRMNQFLLERGRE